MEWRLFDPASPPEWTTPEWYAERESAPHLEQEGHRERLLLTADFVDDAFSRMAGAGIRGNGAADVLDLGAGDGGLLSVIQDRHPETANFGYDLQQSNVDAASKRGVIVELEDVVANLRSVCAYDIADILVATEMLEHLIDPHAFVKALSYTPSYYFVASSPYTETDTHHYDFHTWAWDLNGYRSLLEDNGWRVVRQETAWISQVLLAERA